MCLERAGGMNRSRRTGLEPDMTTVLGTLDSPTASPQPTRTLRVAVVCIAVAALLSSGCASVRKVATDKVADALSADSDVYASDSDISLVGAATPFGLKTIESVLAATPEH